MGLISWGFQSLKLLWAVFMKALYEQQFFAPNLNSKNSIYVHRKGVAKETVADEACHLFE